MNRCFHVDGDQPDKDQIFVFGSNLSGYHGGGAARAAHEHYGATWGPLGAVGMQGQSYAIPTKARNVVDSLPIEAIKIFIDQFIDYAKGHKNQRFFVTRIGCGLAGFTDAQIAPMFKDAPGNCSFAEQWYDFLR